MKEGENPREREKECQGPEVTTKEKRRVKGKKENGKEFPFYFPSLALHDLFSSTKGLSN